MRLPRVLRPISLLIAALQGVKGELLEIGGELAKLSATLREQGPATARLEALELARLQWEATCEGLLLKAEGKLRAANNAEARERANKRSYEHLLDPLAEVGDEPETAARHPDRDDDAAFSEAKRLQSLRLDVAPNHKALAQRAKWGVR